VFESHASNSSWVSLSGNDTAAVGPDCAFLTRGPSDNLTVCEAACAADGSCNVVNYSPTVPDCVMRACADPMHPQLSPYPGYSVFGTVKAAYYIDPAAFTIAITGYSDEALQEAAARYAGIFFAYGFGAGASGFPANASVLPGLQIAVAGYAPLDWSTDESYTLVAPDGTAGGWATLTATTVFGAMRGLETFSQLLAYNLTSRVYSTVTTVVQDAPRFPYRAVMVDTSRHFISPPAIKLILDHMSYCKLNVLHLHLTDDQSWPVELESYPLLAQLGAYSGNGHTYSHNDLADIVRYALVRGIRVIPEFDTPAHFSTLFNAYPQYAANAVDQNNNSFLCLVDPSREETFDFLAGVWGEIASLFPDSTVHIGGDEFWGCWGESPAVQAWMAANGLDVYGAYHYYERRMIDLARSLGKRPMAWLDIAGFPENFNNSYASYPDFIFDVWTGCYSGNWQDDTATFTSQNASVVVSGPFYITQQNGAPDTPHFTWQDMYRTDLFNFTGGNVTAQADLVLGGELCAWDDAAQTDSGDLWMSLTPYMIGVAEPWWSPQEATSGVDPDEERAHAHRCRLGARGIASHPIYAFGTYCPVEYAPPLAAWDAPAAPGQARARVVVVAAGKGAAAGSGA
jgi:hexosaminidase